MEEQKKVKKWNLQVINPFKLALPGEVGAQTWQVDNFHTHLHSSIVRHDTGDEKVLPFKV